MVSILFITTYFGGGVVLVVMVALFVGLQIVFYYYYFSWLFFLMDVDVDVATKKSFKNQSALRSCSLRGRCAELTWVFSQVHSPCPFPFRSLKTHCIVVFVKVLFRVAGSGRNGAICFLPAYL